MNRNGKLEKVTRVLAKLAEIAHWIGMVGMVVGLVLTFVMGKGAVALDPGDAGQAIRIYSFELDPFLTPGEADMAALRLLMVAGFFAMGLMAMVFRNVGLILKNSENTTPFLPDNVRMVREIGIFLMAQPVVAFVMNIVCRVVLGPDIEVSMDLSGIFIGLVMLCLSQFFARGMALETDVDGLV